MKTKQKDVKDILVRSRLPGGGYSANPYVGCTHGCRYCYAAFMTRYAGHSEPWGEFVDVKNWDDISRPERYAGKPVFLSSVTDPYQPAEARYGRTRQLLGQLRGSGCRLSVVTKSDLIVRDVDLIASFPDAVVAWSLNTLDDDFRRDMDRAASVSRRLDAMKMFHQAGVRTACFIAPVFPCITDIPALLEALAGRCDEVWVDKLNLRGPNRRVVLDYIACRWPGLLPLYRYIYDEGGKDYWIGLDAQIRDQAAGFPGAVKSFIGGHGAGAAEPDAAP